VSSGLWPLGIVDAAVIAIAERLQLTEIATLDHRHFAVVQPSHTREDALCWVRLDIRPPVDALPV
jgi:hypothetical protein